MFFGSPFKSSPRTPSSPLNAITMMQILSQLSSHQKRRLFGKLYRDDNTVQSLITSILQNLIHHQNQALIQSITTLARDMLASDQNHQFTAIEMIESISIESTFESTIESISITLSTLKPDHITKIPDPILSKIGSYLPLSELTQMERVNRQFFIVIRRYPALSTLDEGHLCRWYLSHPANTEYIDIDRFRGVEDIMLNEEDLNGIQMLNDLNPTGNGPSGDGSESTDISDILIFENVTKLCFSDISMEMMLSGSIHIAYESVKYLELFCTEFESGDAIKWLDFLCCFPSLESLTVDTCFVDNEDPDAFGKEIEEKWTSEEIVRLKQTLTKLTCITIRSSHSVITRKLLNVLIDQIEVLHLHHINSEEMADGVHLNLSVGEHWKALREVRLWNRHGPSFWKGIWYLNRNRMDKLQSLDLCVNMKEGWDTVNDSLWDALETKVADNNLSHFRIKGTRNN